MGTLNLDDPRFQPPPPEPRFWRAFRAGAWGFIGGAFFGTLYVPDHDDLWFHRGVMGLVSGAVFAVVGVVFFFTMRDD